MKKRLSINFKKRVDGFTFLRMADYRVKFLKFL